MKRQLKKKLPEMYNKIYPLMLIIATLMMGFAYATLNGTSLEIQALATAITQDGVIISEVKPKSATNATLKVKSTNETLLNSKVTLAATNVTTEVTYIVSVYNNTNHDYYFAGILCDTSDQEFYSNQNIIYNISNGPELGQILSTKSEVSFEITFKYKDGITPSDQINELESYINFKFEPVSALVENIITTISSTTGIFENNSSSQIYELTITNDNSIPITYSVSAESTDAITFSGGVSNFELAANTSTTINITLSAVSEYAYIGEDEKIDITIKMINPTTIDVTNYTITILTPNTSSDNPKLLTISVGGGCEVIFEEGMTWEEWINSAYNTDNRITLDGEYVMFDITFYLCCMGGPSAYVKRTDVINPDYIYGAMS